MIIPETVIRSAPSRSRLARSPSHGSSSGEEDDEEEKRAVVPIRRRGPDVGATAATHPRRDEPKRQRSSPSSSEASGSNSKRTTVNKSRKLSPLELHPAVAPTRLSTKVEPPASAPRSRYKADRDNSPFLISHKQAVKGATSSPTTVKTGNVVSSKRHSMLMQSTNRTGNLPISTLQHHASTSTSASVSYSHLDQPPLNLPRPHSLNSPPRHPRSSSRMSTSAYSEVHDQEPGRFSPHSTSNLPAVNIDDVPIHDFRAKRRRSSVKPGPTIQTRRDVESRPEPPLPVAATTTNTSHAHLSRARLSHEVLGRSPAIPAASSRSSSTARRSLTTTGDREDASHSSGAQRFDNLTDLLTPSFIPGYISVSDCLNIQSKAEELRAKAAAKRSIQ